MNRRCEEGFVLYYVVVLMALIGLSVLLLTKTSNTMIKGTNRICLNAHARNLEASARVWAQRNITGQEQLLPGGPVNLNVGSLPVAVTDCTIKIDKKAAGPSPVTIQIACSRNRISVKRTVSIAPERQDSGSV